MHSWCQRGFLPVFLLALAFSFLYPSAGYVAQDGIPPAQATPSVRIVRGDLNADLKVNIFDILKFLEMLSGKKPATPASDLNGSGRTDIFDLLVLLQLMTKPPEPEPGVVWIDGKVQQLAGLDLTKLKVVSPLTEDSMVSANGSFSAKIADSMGASFAVAVDTAGNPLFLCFLSNLPGTVLAGADDTPTQARPAAAEEFTLGVESTALSLIMLNPVLFGSSAAERQAFYSKAMLYAGSHELITGIANVLSADPASKYLIDNSHPELFALADEIAKSVYDAMVAEGLLQLAGATDRPAPGIQVATAKKIELTNPFYIYYGTGIYKYGSSQLKDVFTLQPCDLDWGATPYAGTYSVTQDSVTPSDSLTAKVVSGFNFSSQYWWNRNYPDGRGSLYNSAKIVADLLDLVLKTPGARSRIEPLVGALAAFNNPHEIQTGFQNKEGPEVLNAFLELISAHDESIMDTLWQETATGSVKNYANLMLSVADNVFKVFTVDQRVPFWDDLLNQAPADTVYDFMLQGLQIVWIIPSQPTYKLSGRVLEDSISQKGLSGVEVSITGSGVVGGLTQTTDANGAFSFSGLPNGTYKITPSKSSYSFNPATKDVAISGADLSAGDFTATLNLALHRISGTVFCLSGDWWGVQIILSGDKNATTTTSSSGSYYFDVPNGTYFITPVPQVGYMFEPSVRSVIVKDKSITGLNFFIYGITDETGIPAL